MSAPSIPNLNSLRRGGLRGRGRGRGSSGGRETEGAGTGTATRIAPGTATSASPARSRHDEIVQNTDGDAATSRLSAVNAGYLDDPFAALLYSADAAPPRRLPLMNRGTYVRTTGIDRIVDTFLAATPTTPRQIISLGAGSDTRYFRLKAQVPHRRPDLLYHEIDFAANTRKKISQMRRPTWRPGAGSHAPGGGNTDWTSPDVRVSEGGASLRSTDYCIHPLDLRLLPAREAEAALPGVDVQRATLIISECCLVYLTPADADAVLSYLTTLFPSSTPLAVVIYEPIRPGDAFGKTMVSNLMSRGIQLQTLEKYAGLDEQKTRLHRHGFAGPHAGAAAADIDLIWRHWVSAAEKERVDGLEWMDEVEEFVLLARHYCIAWGWRAFGAEGAASWSALPAP